MWKSRCWLIYKIWWESMAMVRMRFSIQGTIHTAITSADNNECCKQLALCYKYIIVDWQWMRYRHYTNAIDCISQSFTDLSRGESITEHILSKRTNLRYNLLRFYVRSTITHILGNLKRMRTITPAIGTRPYFNWPWIEASTVFTHGL